MTSPVQIPDSSSTPGAIDSATSTPMSPAGPNRDMNFLRIDEHQQNAIIRFLKEYVGIVVLVAGLVGTVLFIYYSDKSQLKEGIAQNERNIAVIKEQIEGLKGKTSKSDMQIEKFELIQARMAVLEEKAAQIEKRIDGM
jgi:hypothetical protein